MSISGFWRGWAGQPQESGPDRCYFFGKYPDCYNVNPQLCSFCGQYLCDKPSPNPCREDYKRRFKAFAHETRRKLHW